MPFSSSPIATATALGVSSGTSSGVDTTGANLLVAQIAWYDQITALPNISDSNGNTWTALTRQIGNNISDRIFYCVSPTVGAGHTFSFSGSDTYSALVVTAWSGAHATPIVAENGAQDGTGDATSLATGSVTATDDGSLFIAGLCFGEPATISIDTGFTIAATLNHNAAVNVGGSLAYFVQTTAGALNPTWSSTVAQVLVATIAVFKPAIGGGTASFLAQRRSRNLQALVARS